MRRSLAASVGLVIAFSGEGTFSIWRQSWGDELAARSTKSDNILSFLTSMDAKIHTASGTRLDFTQEFNSRFPGVSLEEILSQLNLFLGWKKFQMPIKEGRYYLGVVRSDLRRPDIPSALIPAPYEFWIEVDQTDSATTVKSVKFVDKTAYP